MIEFVNYHASFVLLINKGKGQTIMARKKKVVVDTSTDIIKEELNVVDIDNTNVEYSDMVFGMSFKDDEAEEVD